MKTKRDSWLLIGVLAQTGQPAPDNSVVIVLAVVAAVLIIGLVGGVLVRRRKAADETAVVPLVGLHKAFGDTTTQKGIPSPTPGESAKLVLVRSPRMDTAEWSVLSTPFRLGRRGGRTDLNFNDDPKVSRNHATIIYEEGKFKIIDESAQNGTFVNDRRITGDQPYIVEPGSEVRLRLGPDTEMRFIVGEGAVVAHISNDKQLENLLRSNESPVTIENSLRLIMVDRESRNELYRIDHTPFSVGSKEGNQVRLEAKGLSRKHFLLYYDGQSFYIEDNNSANGTSVRGKRLAPGEFMRLAAGQEHSIRIGERIAEFKFTYSKLLDESTARVEIHDNEADKT